MAPDLNAVASGNSQWEYSAPGSAGYDIPDVNLNSSKNRRLRVLTVGAGVSGILMAYQIQKYCPNVEHVIYEKNSNIGGTWLENRYPGCACDIPSHAYTYNFALNPDWPQYFSRSPDIWKYLNKVCETFDLRKYMTFRTECVGCWWQEDTGKWKVKLREHKEGGETRDFDEECDLLLPATGILNNFKWPDIPGLKDFKGRVVHTARWPDDYQEEQWKNDRVAVIGSGASSIQTVPNMQPHVKHMDVFVRTGVWFVSIAGQTGVNKEYSKEERDKFRSDPRALAEQAKFIEDQINGLWGAFYSDTEAQAQAQEFFKGHMANFIKDERLLKGFTPKFGVGCRRITPGDPYMMAIQEDNVDVHFTKADTITEKGVVGGDGVERECDTIVCATGFDVSYKSRFPIVGKNGIDINEKWKVVPESYLGLAVPDFPNMLLFIGPTWPVENGSVMGPLLTVSEYAVQVIKKMQWENLKAWSPRQDVTDSFNEHAQEFIKHTIWKDDCRAWYRNNETGRVNAIWPGSSLHYQQVIKAPRWEDMEIEYHNKRNQWAFLGLGWVDAHRNHGAFEQGQEKPPTWADASPYLHERFLDWRWIAAMADQGEGGLTKEQAKELVIQRAADDAAGRLREEIERQERGEAGASMSTMGWDGRVI